YLDDGDHSFKPRKASGKTQEEHIVTAATLTASFIEAHLNN
ncbi:MAG: alpha/beta family hydrolase, partial [Pseudomonadota bacterium]|nr:alpha/beta family hydrolase [Pseudomonadota bacterium]